MKKLLPATFFIILFFALLSGGYAQTNQTVTNGQKTAPENFAGSCTYNWANSNPSIGLPANGTGNIPAFMAINTGNSPVTATITATPASNGFAYITNDDDGTISIINVTTNTVVSTLMPPHDPFSVCISPDGTKAYIGCGGGLSTVAVINTSTNTVISTIPVNPSGEATGLTISPDGTLLYVEDYVNGIVSVVNTVTSVVVAAIAVGQNPYGIAISPDGSKVYVAFTYTNYISVINTATNTVTANITVGSTPSDVSVSPDGSKVYVPVSSLNQIAVIDPITNKVTTVIPIGATPVVMALSPDGTRAYVATISYTSYPNPCKVLVINTANNAVIATIVVGAAVNGICVTPDGHFVYVANTESNNVSVINTSTNLVIATVNVGHNPVSAGHFITAGAGCATAPITFTITVNPSIPIPTIIASTASGNINSCQGTASVAANIQQFTVSGSNLTGNITATAPAGFELSLNSISGYNSILTLAQSNATVSNTLIYVRSSSTAPAGNISDNVVLSSAGATDQPVAVSAVINAIPILNTPGSQTLVNGGLTVPVNFTGTGNTYSWINDTPGVGLAANGTGNIPAFTAINNTVSPVTATITVTPVNGTSCNGPPVKFTITVNPTPASLAATGALTSLTTAYGKVSRSESFTISGTTVTSGILITSPAGYEVSSNGNAFNATTFINVTGNISSVAVYIRLASATHVGNYSGNIVVSTGNAASINVTMPQSEVTPAPLNITADNKSKPFDAINPALTVTYSGFVNNDGPAQLITQPYIITTATIRSAVGQYPIIPAGASSTDYLFNYIQGILTVNPSLSSLSIPNTFTPNGDGINDTWVIRDLEYYHGLTVNIFNRFGQILFSSVGYPVPWDGKYKGEALPSGAYYYIIDPKNGQSAISGWLAIIR